MEYDPRALGSDTCGPSAAFMERNKGAWGGGWCLAVHEGRKSDGSDAWPARKRTMVEAGPSHAALGFDGDRAIGWAHDGPRAQLPYTTSRRAVEAGAEVETLADGPISCFCVDTANRRRALGARALERATGAVARAGGGNAEAFPEAIEGQETSDSFLWSGTSAMVDQTGCARIRKIGMHRWVMCRAVEGALR